MVGPVKISYVNNSGYTIPPYGVVELSGDMQLLSNGERSIPVTRPSGKGPYAIDDGKGANGTDSGKYGTAIIPYDNLVWVAWDGTDPGVAWKDQVGPIKDTFKVGNKGQGYLYAGERDSINFRILVVQTIPRNVRMICAETAGDENTWVFRPRGNAQRTTQFKAVIPKDFSLRTLQDWLNPQANRPIVYVTTRFIAGGIFTGNEFIATPTCAASDDYTTPYPDMKWDVVACASPMRYKAKYKTLEDRSSGAEIAFDQHYLNTAASVPGCIQRAGNDTGRYFSEGQNVWVEWTQDGWHITDFECAPAAT